MGYMKPKKAKLRLLVKIEDYEQTVENLSPMQARAFRRPGSLRKAQTGK